jgi:hypothetical protein
MRRARGKEENVERDESDTEETHHTSSGPLDGIHHSLSDVISKYLIPGTEGHVVNFRDYQSPFTETQIMDLQEILLRFLNNEKKSHFNELAFPGEGSSSSSASVTNGNGVNGKASENGRYTVEKTEVRKSSVMFYFAPVPRELDIMKMMSFQIRLDRCLPGFRFVPGGTFTSVRSSMVGFTKPGDSRSDAFVAMCSGDTYAPYFKFTAKRPSYAMDIVLWLAVIGLFILSALVYCNFQQEYAKQGYTLEDAWKEVTHFAFQ